VHHQVEDRCCLRAGEYVHRGKNLVLAFELDGLTAVVEKKFQMPLQHNVLVVDHDDLEAGMGHFAGGDRVSKRFVIKAPVKVQRCGRGGSFLCWQF
jgi:hypothetical protein